jgi:hypothetical protein
MIDEHNKVSWPVTSVRTRTLNRDELPRLENATTHDLASLLTYQYSQSNSYFAKKASSLVG